MTYVLIAVINIYEFHWLSCVFIRNLKTEVSKGKNPIPTSESSDTV